MLLGRNNAFGWPAARDLLLAVLLALCLLNLTAAQPDRQWSGSVGLWGKRSAPFQMLDKRTIAWQAPLNSQYLWEKRAAQWQAANGLWGKRSAPTVP